MNKHLIETTVQCRLLGFVVFVFLILSCSSQAQGTWTQQSAIPITGGRTAAVAFSIGGKGYLGTGEGIAFFNANYFQDLWEYDPTTEIWTQKADFSGGPRAYATGFVIGNYGYLGTGENTNGILQNDLWRYDPVANTWIQEASLNSGVREAAVGFSVGGKGYIGTGQTGVSGQSSSSCLADMWEYDPTLNTWTPKQNFPPGGRTDIDRGVFVYGNKAYLGTGRDCNNSFAPQHYNDFWEFDPVANVWTPKSNFPGVPRRGTVGFALCDAGFFGLGTDANSNPQSDLWRYAPASDTWTLAAVFPGSPRWDEPSFVVGGKAFVGTGVLNESAFGIDVINDCWSFSYPVKAVVSANATICTGTSITLAASGGTQYSWSNGDTTNTITVTPTTTTSYTVAVSNQCAATLPLIS